ncbi:MAG: octanoyltransferase [Legionellales bacterium RIFCSPHIGHO2_12_FULL_37_14]|nr:MAG: octanoyltransferase [Legionellales bacterium RIFCSPHIGHO2_12_FULL_37_14]
MLHIHELGIQQYPLILERMQTFTKNRTENTVDEMWLLEHYPVYTQGLRANKENLLKETAIQVIHSDRGGQITYHGPGQLVAYCLLNLKRRALNIKSLVFNLETVLINLLQELDIKGTRQCGAPGVYVENKKIASLGLRVKNGCSYHGIALNIDMDLTPFTNINPCGFTKLAMTKIQNYQPNISFQVILSLWIKHFLLLFEEAS